MPSQPLDCLAYYTKPGITTTAGEYAHLLDSLPNDIGALCAVAQGLIVHIFWWKATV